MLNKNKPFLVILTAPSGAGKTTIRKTFIQKFRDVKYSISATTREPREDETDGEDYHFISPDTFREWISEDKFCEWAEVYGSLYGTPKEPLEKYLNQGHKVLLTLDIQGMRKIKLLYPGSIAIFVLPPSLLELENRLAGRGETNSDAINKRLSSAELELSHLREFDYAVVNEDVNKSVDEIAVIISAEEHSVKRMESL